MTENAYESLLIKCGALSKGHFVLNAGDHADLYVNKTKGLVMTSRARTFGEGLAQELMSIQFDAFAAPELGAITLMTRVADACADRLRRDFATVIVEKDRDPDGRLLGTMSVKREQAAEIEGKKIVIIEDLGTTGDSVRKAVKAVRNVGGEVAAVAMLWNRGGVTSYLLDVPFLFSLVDTRIQSFSEAECPLCKMGISINTNLGKGKEYLARKKAQG